MENKANILVVDDDEDIGSMLKMMMEYKGYAVTLINRATEAENVLSGRRVDLIVLDMLIAGTNGTDVCKSIRSKTCYTHIPILMISALPDARQVCIDAGANDFVSKPFDMDLILNKVRSLIHVGQAV